MDDLRPVGRVVVIDFLVALAGHAGDHKAKLSVGLILALGVQVKEYGTVSIVDGFKADALAVVVVGFLIFINRSQPPGTNAAAYCFLECVVIGFVGHGCLLISAI